MAHCKVCGANYLGNYARTTTIRTSKLAKRAGAKCPNIRNHEKLLRAKARKQEMIKRSSRIVPDTISSDIFGLNLDKLARKLDVAIRKVRKRNGLRENRVNLVSDARSDKLRNNKRSKSK